MLYFYLSFATDETGFLGSTVVEADSEDGAILIATLLGRNPGGEILILPVPDEALDEPDIQVLKTKLVGEAEALALGGLKQKDHPELEEIATFGAVLCEDCNPVMIRSVN